MKTMDLVAQRGGAAASQPAATFLCRLGRANRRCSPARLVAADNSRWKQWISFGQGVGGGSQPASCDVPLPARAGELKIYSGAARRRGQFSMKTMDLPPPRGGVAASQPVAMFLCPQAERERERIMRDHARSCEIMRDHVRSCEIM